MTKLQKELERRIKEAVEPHRGLPIALSGGIDSSLLAALSKPSLAISVKLPLGEPYDEIDYAKVVADHLGLRHFIVECDDRNFDDYMTKAVKAIGRPIPHFNIFPLYCMYQRLAELGVKQVILGDGPDEVMCGYARDLIFHYLYGVYDFEAFGPYKELIDRVLPSPLAMVYAMTNKTEPTIQEADIKMRQDMDDMSNGIARHFGITNIRPYQDNADLDEFMASLPIAEKIHDVEFGKYALRCVAEKYLPQEIVWRKIKRGGPVYPVNRLRNWMDNGEFDKTEYLKYQWSILSP